MDSIEQRLSKLKISILEQKIMLLEEQMRNKEQLLKYQYVKQLNNMNYIIRKQNYKLEQFGLLPIK